MIIKQNNLIFLSPLEQKYQIKIVENENKMFIGAFIYKILLNGLVSCTILISRIKNYKKHNVNEIFEIVNNHEVSLKKLCRLVEILNIFIYGLDGHSLLFLSSYSYLNI